MLLANAISIERKNELGKVEFEAKNVSLQIDRSEIVSFVGASGSGKTTIAEILSGFLSPKSGSVKCDNKDIKQPESQIALVLQDYRNAVFPWLSVKQNIELGYYKPNSSKRYDIKKIIGLLSLTEDFLSSYPHKLSGGQIQKVQIGRALLSGTDFLILDEPTSSLDMKFREELLTILIELKKQNFGILLITHNIDEAVFIGKRVYMSRKNSGKTFEIINIEGYNHKCENISVAQNDSEYIRIFQCVYKTIF